MHAPRTGHTWTWNRRVHARDHVAPRHPLNRADIEEAIKAQPKQLFAVDQLRPLLYQMLFALYASQRELGLRHYDIKLLNFFLADPASRLPPQSAATTGEGQESAPAATALTVDYGVCGRVHQLTLPTGEPSLALLADFGTADISPATLHEPIGLAHFATLENTPPDFLLCGTAARQDFLADAFALGLCWLHLLTGARNHRPTAVSALPPIPLEARFMLQPPPPHYTQPRRTCDRSRAIRGNP